MRRMPRRWRQIGAVAASVLAVVTVVATTVGWSGQARAYVNCGPGAYIDYGRYSNCGYFDDKYDPVGDRLWNGGVPGNVPNPASTTALQKAQDFINWVEANRNSLNAADRTSGEFVIDTMEGLYPPGNARGLAWTLENDWENRILGGIRNGTLAVNFFYAMPWGCGQENTYYQVPENDVAFYITSPATSETPACGPGVTTPAIRFFNPKTGATIYTIKRNCGNPVGNLSALPSANFNVTLTANFQGTQVAAGYGGPRFQVVSGTTYKLGEGLSNAGPAISPPGNLQVDWTTQVNRPCNPNCTPAAPLMTNLTGGHGGAMGFRNNVVVAGGSGPNWQWRLATGLASGATTSSSLEFVPNAPVGTTFVLDVWFSPGDVNGAVRHVAVPFIIVSERHPGFVGSNGDVHAGGGFCELPQTNPAANITGDAAGNSGSQYVVSASGAVGDFTSNGTGADTLKLGKNGNYAQVCRPDLYTLEAGPYCAAGVGFATISGTQLIQNLNPSVSVYCANGGTLKLSGNVTRKITIVATGGTSVEINGNITLCNGGCAPASSNQVASLGIISANNITIDAAATRVDAYLFADDTLDTCVEADAACNNELTVNGFLMANNILLHRLGPNNSNDPAVGENIVLNPEIYLNPPQFFDASVDNIQLNGLGERQPLF